MTFRMTCPVCAELTNNSTECGVCGARLIPTDDGMEAVRVLRAEVIERVGTTAEAIQAAALKVENLRADEPRQQPPTPRAVALRDIQRDLEHTRRRLLDLFS